MLNIVENCILNSKYNTKNSYCRDRSNAKSYSEKVSIIAKFVANSIGHNLPVVDISVTSILIGTHHGILSASKSYRRTRECIQRVGQCARMTWLVMISRHALR